MSSKNDSREPAMIEVSFSNAEARGRKFWGTIHERQAEGLTVVIEEEIAASTAVRVQGKNLLSFGEVLCCVPEPNDMWAVHVAVKRSILMI